MPIDTETRTQRGGGAWLLEEVSPQDVFTPEDLSEEHRLMGRTAEAFMRNEVIPRLEELERKDFTLVRDLFRKAGELGLLGADVPEAYGGLALDKVSSMLISAQLVGYSSFTAAYGGSCGIGTWPIVYFGTEAQKRKYLPRITTGELVSSYALSESGSGSDALAARARADLSADGSHYVLNGEKMWITNGGFADLFITFAKVDGDKFSCFIVERGFPGVSSGREEHKMGLHGSSTCPLILQDARVPAENLLGEVGKGHKIAFNVLNLGRFKLAASCAGGSRLAAAEAARYAAQRKQFGRPIASFGAIRHKLGEMVARAFAAESMLFRVAGHLEGALAGVDERDPAAAMRAVEEFAIECSMSKVFASEALDYILDENIQIHGGNGYVEDYPAERHYRDSRVNRIFEGTNEINRLLIPGMLIRRALKGEIGLIPAAKRLQDELLSPAPADTQPDETAFADERRQLASVKKIALMCLGAAMQRFGEALTDEQEVLTFVADILTDTFAAETVVVRAIKTAASPERAGLYADLVRVFVSEAAARIDLNARRALAAIADGDMLRTMGAALRRLSKPPLVDTVAPRRRLAEAITTMGRYPF